MKILCKGSCLRRRRTVSKADSSCIERGHRDGWKLK